MSASRDVLRLQQRDELVSASVEWPIVQIRVAGIHQFPFNRRAGEERAGRGEVDGELLVVLRRRLAGLQLEHRHAAVTPPDQTVERAAQNHLRAGRPNRKRHLEEWLAGCRALQPAPAGAQREIGVAGPVEQLLEIFDLGHFVVPDQARSSHRRSPARSRGRKRRRQPLEQPMHERAGQACPASPCRPAGGDCRFASESACSVTATRGTANGSTERREIIRGGRVHGRERPCPTHGGRAAHGRRGQRTDAETRASVRTCRDPLHCRPAAAELAAASNVALRPRGKDVPRLPPSAPSSVLRLRRQVQPVARAGQRDIQQALGFFAILRLRVFVGFGLKIADAQPCASAVSDPTRRESAWRRPPVPLLRFTTKTTGNSSPLAA